LVTRAARWRVWRSIPRPYAFALGLRIVDLSADYRLNDQAVYEKAYAIPHADPANLQHAVYGLPELFGDAIPEADLVANPGCYPTAATLGIAPLLQRSLVKPTGIIINAASGITGAGKSPKPNLHFPEMNEAMSPYNTGIHRHQPEIDQNLTRVRGEAVSVLFSPHLVPLSVGILETIYLDPQDEDVSEADLYEAFEDAYGDKPFVRVRANMPDVKYVRGTNFCDIAVRLVRGKVVVFAAIDNMVKGASGQAVQNMNLMFDQDETAGLL
jgi:N-acetyl-gamma-glutamyl-phosphate reductase